MGFAHTIKDDAARRSQASYFADLCDSDTAPVSAAQAAHRQAPLPDYRPDAEAFLAMGERMLRSARQHHLPLAVLVVQVPELPELEIVFGRAAAKAAVHAVMKALSSVAGHGGLAVRTLPDTFAVVMPRSTGPVLQMALRNRLGRACSVELDFDGEEIVLVPEFQARTVDEGNTIEKTYSGLCRAIESQRYLEQLRRDHLRREREAHSTHMSLPPELAHAPALPRSRGWYPTIPATIFMPVAKH
jgi:GGDEF domain-containing protein